MMNPETREFTPIDDPSDAPSSWPVFRIGEIVIFRGWKWKIMDIDKSGVRCEPVCKAPKDHPSRHQEINHAVLDHRTTMERLHETLQEAERNAPARAPTTDDGI